jgi:ATP-dependent Lon protease
VLCIGGLKEKLLAARQYNFKTVLIPHENENDLKDLRKEVDFGGLTIIPVHTMDDVIGQVFLENPLTAIKEHKKKPRKQKPKASSKNSS